MLHKNDCIVQTQSAKKWLGPWQKTKGIIIANLPLSIILKLSIFDLLIAVLTNQISFNLVLLPLKGEN